ncbi:MAG TPA: diaminopimelate epimerase [Spirochaetota bacterium]|nr:diaminopimelate epimerase [Spirochaetota bacterium]
MIMDFYKYHGLGNDYIVIDPAKNGITLSPETIRLICDRNLGIGSDGILHGPFSDNGAISVRIFNPDGSEAEKSGNGARIFARHLHEHGHVNGDTAAFNTLGGPITARVLDPASYLIKVNMGACIFDSERIPVSGPRREVMNEPIEIGGNRYLMTCVSMGNPHCVIPLKAISRELACELGPSIERHPLFPNRINMQLAQVIDRQSLRIEIWERGAGYTLASGSSSCAAACAARRLGLVDGSVTVHMPGGTLLIDIGSDWSVSMTGPVASVSEGNFTPEFRKLLAGV